jgi:hypothetical protein
MRHFLGPLAVLAFVALAWAADPATTKKKTLPKKTTATSKSRTSSGKAVTRKTTSTSTTTRGGKKAPVRKATAAWRTRQMQPTQDRYKEIQDALVTKGYLRAEDANGSWNQNSVDAMKRFQAEQKIDSNGKINSLSLIALGLGPKRETPPPTPPKQ